MIGKDGQIKLMDFGIASIGSEESMTEAGMLMGSLAHVAPEVIKGHKATVASDIFSLGTVFYWLLAGQLPFAGDSPHALLKAIVDNEPKKVVTLSPYIADDLASVLEESMRKSPNNRFKSAHDMGEAIEQALSHMGVAIDSKLLLLVLQEKIGKLGQFKAVIFEQITKQIELFKNQKNDAAAFALMCRLEASPSVLKKKHSLRAFYKVLVFSFCLMLVCFVAVLIIYPSNKNMTHHIVDPISNRIPYIGILEAENLAKEDRLEPAQPIEPKPKNEEPEELLQEIHVVVWPFANVRVDGKTVAKNQKSLRLMLKKGVHRLLFSHTYAATVEKTINITDIGPPIDLSISLIKSKPAFLVVKSDVDGDVAVDGHYKGTAYKSILRPIVIPLPDKTHASTKEIIVSQEGFEPFIVKIEIIAGQIKEIEVTLKPNPHAQ